MIEMQPTVPDTLSLAQTHYLLLAEAHEERASIPALYGVSFKRCLERKGLATEILVRDGLTVRGQDVYKAWLKYEQGRGKAYLLKCRLVGVVYDMAADFGHWLTTEYTARYRAMTDPVHHAWLIEVGMLTARRRILLTKLANRINGKTFADSFVERRAAVIVALQEIVSESARGAHHAGREYDAAFERVMERIDTLTHQVIEMVQAELPEPLEPLPLRAPVMQLPSSDEGGAA